MAFERISLNIIPDGEMPIFHASQFDAGRPIIIDLYNGDDAYTPAAGVTFELHCRKVDDNIVTLDTYEVDGNTITFASTEQLCACSGDNLCEVAIMLDDLLMGTLNFILHVERDPLAGGLTSETSIYNLTQQIDDIISGEGYVKDTDLEVLQSDWDETDPASPAYIKNKPGPALADQADWTETDPLKQSYIKHKPDLKTVATTGSYNDLTDKPTIPTKTSELTNDSGFVESSDLAAVATSGDYDDLLNKPAIPAAQVQSDWNQSNTSAVDFIKNKPDLMLVKSATGNPCTFETDLADNLVSLKANIVASGGGGTPSTPIPIVGYSSANITRCGKNLLNYDAWKTVSVYHGNGVFEDNGITITATVNDCYTEFNNENYPLLARVYVNEGETITLSWSSTETTQLGRVYIFPNGEATGNVNGYNNENHISYTVPSGVKYVSLRFGVTSNGNTIHYKNIMIKHNNVATAFEPYNGQTYTIAFGQKVYGGVLDANRGKVRITHSYGKLTSGGWTHPATFAQGAFLKILPFADSKLYDGFDKVADALCNVAPIATPAQIAQGTLGVGFGNGNYFYLCIDTSLVTTSDLDDFLDNNDVYVCYELATPIDIDLTPVQISALVGTNNITSDLGGDVNVRYVSGELAGQIIDICKMVIAEEGE